VDAAADLTVNSLLTATGTGKIEVGGDLYTGNGLTLSNATTDALTVTGHARINVTLTGSDSAANVITFSDQDEPSIIASFNPRFANTVIAGAGAVEIVESYTSTVTVLIKNTGGVTVVPTINLASNITGTKVTIVGADANPVTIGGTTLAITGGSIEVDADVADASIVAGGANGTVTITGAKLSGGNFTAANAAEATLTLAADAEIEVAADGAVTIGTVGQIVFTDGDSKISLLAGGSLVASSGTSDLIKTGEDQTKVKLDASVDGNDNKLLVGASENVYTVTRGATEKAAGTVILGKIKFTIPNTYSAAISGVAATGDEAAGGTLVAGEGTTLTLAGAA
jgi:hypothetical protein